MEEEFLLGEFGAEEIGGVSLGSGRELVELQSRQLRFIPTAMNEERFLEGTEMNEGVGLPDRSFLEPDLRIL